MQQTAKLQELTQNRLSTGLRVNSAIDNPSSYYTAAALNNRASDLSALLDAMSQGIQTLKAAQQGLQTASTFLEQAASIANQALETEPVPAKDWFEQQVGENGAVVSTREELLNAINSGAKGNIVIYGKINLSETITLQDGQNLIGVGYYSSLNPEATDSELNKFSTLNFTGLKDQSAINLTNKSAISDLSVYMQGETSDFAAAINAPNSINIKLSNIDIAFDIKSTLPGSEKVKGIYATGSSGELAGSVNIRDLNYDIYTTPSNQMYRYIGIEGGNFTIEGYSQLNIKTGGFSTHVTYLKMYDNSSLNTLSRSSALHSSHISAYGNAKVNIKSSILALYGGSYNFYGNSEINILTDNNKPTALGSLQEAALRLNDSSRANIDAGNNLMPLINIQVSSTTAKLILNYTHSYFYKSGSLDIISGASIYTNHGTYTSFVDGSVAVNNDDEPPASNFVKDALTTTLLNSSFIPDFTHFLEKRPEDKAFAEMKATEESELSNNSNSYNELLQQFDLAIKDSSYKGKNLLIGDNLIVNFNEDRTSKIEILGTDIYTDKLGLKTKEWKSKGNIYKSLSELESAINQLRSYSQELGNHYAVVTAREDFTNNLINVLTEGADKLTLADMNEESANSLMLKTRQNLAINALSLASQATQSILKLF